MHAYDDVVYTVELDPSGWKINTCEDVSCTGTWGNARAVDVYESVATAPSPVNGDSLSIGSVPRGWMQRLGIVEQYRPCE